MIKKEDVSVISFGSFVTKKQKEIWKKIEIDAFKGNENHIMIVGIPKPKEYIEREFFVLKVGDEYAGRAVVTVDKNYIEKKDQSFGFIDFFTMREEYKKHSSELIKKCLSFFKDKKVSRVLVRYSFPALQYTEFDEFQPFGFPHTPTWYINLFQKQGFIKTKRWVNYRFKFPKDIPKEGVEAAEKLIKELKITVRPLKTWNAKEVRECHELMFRAFMPKFGWDPGEKKEMNSTFLLLGHFLLKHLLKYKVWVGIDEDGKIVGSGNYFPDPGWAIQKLMKEKKYDCPKIVRIFRILRTMKKSERAKIGGLGMREDMRGRGFLKYVMYYGLNIMMNEEGFKEIDGGPAVVQDMAGIVKTAEKAGKLYTKYGGDLKQFKYVTLSYKFKQEKQKVANKRNK